jgi:hypothetical protein
VRGLGLRKIVRVLRFSQNCGVVPKRRPRRMAVSALTSRRARMISVMRFAGTSISSQAGGR